MIEEWINGAEWRRLQGFAECYRRPSVGRATLPLKQNGLDCAPPPASPASGVIKASAPILVISSRRFTEGFDASVPIQRCQSAA
jgi:hypothetical protein